MVHLPKVHHLWGESMSAEVKYSRLFPKKKYPSMIDALTAARLEAGDMGFLQ